MKNVEKFIKNNKEVVAIVLLLVLVWMMVRKGGYVGPWRDQKHEIRSPNSEGAQCSIQKNDFGFGTKIVCQNHELKITEMSSILEKKKVIILKSKTNILTNGVD